MLVTIVPAGRQARNTPLDREAEVPMDEDRFNMALRKFLKEVGVTSQREVEKLVRERSTQADTLRLRIVLTLPDAPALNHVVEQTIPLA